MTQGMRRPGRCPAVRLDGYGFAAFGGDLPHDFVRASFA
jgi:hypothetical protein